MSCGRNSLFDLLHKEIEISLQSTPQALSVRLVGVGFGKQGTPSNDNLL
jgi:hypothetical protein